MMRGISAANPHELLPPILACLPTAILSPRPPPALLPLLSPILRHRVRLLAESTPVSSRRPEQPSSGWLRLLTWDLARADRLEEIVSTLQLEPHPVSGELELFGNDTEGGGKVWYKRQDEETLQARCDVKEHDLGVVWVWCADDGGGTELDTLREGHSGSVGEGWRVAEVLPLEGDGYLAQEGWRASLSEAEEAASQPGAANGFHYQHGQANGGFDTAQPSLDSEDDAYWASYDRTPSSQTPNRNSLSQQLSTAAGAGNRTDAEQDYFARYASEVQPAMDAHDPDEERSAPEQIESTLQGNEIPLAQRYSPGAARQRPLSSHSSFSGLEKPNESEDGTTDTVTGRRRGDTIRPTRSNDLPYHASRNSSVSIPSSAVAALQRCASSSTAVEAGVKQHISHEIKSLFRLAQAVGLERTEFEWVVRTELEVLGLVEL